MEKASAALKKSIPAWALRQANPSDLDAVRKAREDGSLNISLPDQNALRAWAKEQRWPTPWFGFEDAFINKMLEDQTSFERAINSSGVSMSLPCEKFTLSATKLARLDDLYSERSPSQRPVGWNVLVAELREIRRAIEAGVVIEIEEGPTLHSWQSFYTWAHGRYHMLEDGADEWIGAD